MNQRNNKIEKEELQVILKRIKECITISKNKIVLNDKRSENRKFIEEYNIRGERLKQILMGLEVEDFCQILQNSNEGYEHELLYVFVPKVGLYGIDGVLELVDIYIKINLIEDYQSNVVVISFHRLNYPIKYKFKDK